MPRKKMMRSVKGKKMQAKTNTKMKKAHVLSLAEKLEKDFRNAPAEIVAQYRKEAVVLKKHETKLSAELKKAQALEKTLKNKHKILHSKQLTPAAKKRLAKDEKVLTQLSKAMKVVADQLAEIKLLGSKLSAKQALYTAIQKELAQFEKQFSKKTAQVTKAKPATKMKKKKSVVRVSENPSSQPEMEQPTEIATTVNEVESAEATS